MTVRVPLTTCRLCPATCDNAACDRDLDSGDGILVFTNTREFRYCDSRCSAQGYRLHQQAIRIAVLIRQATDGRRLEIERQAAEIAGGPVAIDWTDGVLAVLAVTASAGDS